MVLLLELKPEEEQHIQQHASAGGVLPEDYVRRLVACDLDDLERDGQMQRNWAAVALLGNWITEAQRANSEERRGADEERRGAMREVDRNRLSYHRRCPELSELATPKDEEGEAGGSGHS